MRPAPRLPDDQLRGAALVAENAPLIGRMTPLGQVGSGTQNVPLKLPIVFSARGPMNVPLREMNGSVPKNTPCVSV